MKKQLSQKDSEKKQIINYFIMIFVMCIMWGLLPAQSWTQKANFINERHSAVSFFLNNKVYVGGGIDVSDPQIIYTDFWEYDPTLDVWTKKTNLPGLTRGCTAGIGCTINGKGYIGLGRDTNSNFRNDLWEYDGLNDNWTQKTSLPGLGREGAAHFVAGDKLYVVGGAESSRMSSVFEYDPALDTWTLKGNFPGGPITEASGFTINNKGYIVGGDAQIPSNDVTTRCYEYNPSNDQWVQKAPFTGLPRQGMIAFVIDNKAYCGLGAGKYFFSTLYKDIFSYDPVTNSWSAEGNFPGSSRCFAVSCTGNSKAYVGTGYSFGSSDDMFEYEVPITTSLLSFNTTNCNKGIYPNPSSGDLYLRGFDFKNPVLYQLYTIQGQLVSQGTVSDNATIKTSGLSKGSYILSLNTTEKNLRFLLVLYKPD